MRTKQAKNLFKKGDKVGLKSLGKWTKQDRKVGKRGQSRTEKFEKEDKTGQKSDYFIKCYQRFASYIFIFEP